MKKQMKKIVIKKITIDKVARMTPGASFAGKRSRCCK